MRLLGGISIFRLPDKNAPVTLRGSLAISVTPSDS